MSIIKKVIPYFIRESLGKLAKSNFFISTYISNRNFKLIVKKLKYLKDKGPLLLDDFTIKVFSQAGEDGILLALLNFIPRINNYCVEFGTENAKECNTRLLIDKFKWKYLHMDGGKYEDAYTTINQEYITANNINILFEKYNVPFKFDILCIDIDYNNYYVLEAIDSKYQPSIIIAEYNSSIRKDLSLVVIKNNDRMWDGTNYFGASLLAYTKLMNQKGYDLIFCDKFGINSYFVKKDLTHLLPLQYINDVDKLYRSPGYGQIINDVRFGHPDKKEVDYFVEI